MCICCGVRAGYQILNSDFNQCTSGLVTGVVVDTGDGVTHVVPVYDGFVPQVWVVIELLFLGGQLTCTLART